MKWGWFSILAVTSALFLAMTAFISRPSGPTVLTPGRPTGFHCVLSPTAAGQVLNIYTETGDLTCMLRLLFPVDPGLAVHYRANVAGKHLVVTDDPDQPGWILITAPIGAPAERSKFLWPSGVPITVECQAQTRLPVPQQWEVWLNNDDFDSLQRAEWRTLVFWISLALCLTSALGSALIGLSSTKPNATPFDASLCILLLIDNLDGPPDDIERMRRILRMRLHRGVSLAESLAANSVDLKTIQGKRFWFRTRRLFLDQLGFLIRALESARDMIDLPFVT